MKKNFCIIALLTIVCIFPAAAQNKITGLSEVKLFLDPGHAFKENQGLYHYSEAEKVLRVALAVKEYLLAHTDMQAENIRLCREDDNTQRSLTERTDAANAWGADFYYSIHSDAGDVSSNSTLIMYGGWKVAGVVYEKTPTGGKDYGEFLAPNLSGVMRISTRGNMADRTYYDKSETHTYRYPYLHVNRESDMASLLSEGGFHTNRFQQARNLNSQYKRLEAYAAFESLAMYFKNKYGGAGSLPAPGIVFGAIKDDETGRMVNDATITLNDGTGDKVYTTDGYESLFKNYSNNKNEIQNGFFSFEGLTPGATATIKVDAPGYESQSSTVLIPATAGATTIDGMGVKDFSLTNITAPVVEVSVTGKIGAVAIDKPMVLTFSRKMDRTSVESAISINPSKSLTYTWINDFTLNVNISQLDYESDYTLTIKGTAKNSLTGQFLNGSGTAGSNFVLPFTTGEQDITPPTIVSYDPQGEQAEAFRPIVRIQFNEYLEENSILPNQITVTDSNGETVGGLQKYTEVNGFSVLHYLFTEDLTPNEIYTVTMLEGLEDMYGNAMPEGKEFTFQARPRELKNIQVIDPFTESPGTNGWWDPLGSGTTSQTGIDPDISKNKLSDDVPYLKDNPTCLRMNYQFYESDRIIRLHRRGDVRFTKYPNTTIQYYLFGDGSGYQFRITVRAGGSDGSGVIWSCHPFTLDWVGWKLMTWNFWDKEAGEAWLVDGTLFDDGARLDVKDFGFVGKEEFSEYPSYIMFDEIKALELGDYITGNAIPKTKADGINVITIENAIQITGEQPIKNIQVYSITGKLLKSAQPTQVSHQIPTNNLMPGIYIVKVVTETSQQNVKVFVK